MADPMIIDLKEVRGASALGLENQLFQDELERALEMVHDFVEQVDHRVREDQDKLAAYEWEDPRLFHEAILVAGPRGSGKTTFVLSLCKAVEDRSRAHRPERPRGPGQAPGQAAPDGSKFRSFSELTTLPTLDPTLVDGADIFIAAIVANILRRVEPTWRRGDNPRAARALEESLNLLSEGLLAAKYDAWAEHLKKSASAGIFAEQLVSFARGGLQLRRRFNEFVLAAAKLIGVKAFLLPIDDVDMAGAAAFPVLEAVRRYLTGPCILPIITGDIKQFNNMVLENRLGDVPRLQSVPNDRGDEAKVALREARTLASQHLLKLIRPERRFELYSARDAIRKRLPPLGPGVEVLPDSEGALRTDLEVLLRPLLNYTELRPGQGVDVSQALPDNARLLRAVLSWAAERAGKPWTTDDFLRLVSIDAEALAHQRWSRDRHFELMNGNYGPLLEWALTQHSGERLRFDPGERPGTSWEHAVVTRAQSGALGVRFSAGGPGEALRYLLRVAVPAAVVLNTPQTKDERTTPAEVAERILARVDYPTTREVVVQLAGERWANNSRSLQPGLFRLATHPNIKVGSKHPVAQRVQALKQKWDRIGLVPWWQQIAKVGGSLASHYELTPPGRSIRLVPPLLTRRVCYGGYLLEWELRELLGRLNLGEPSGDIERTAADRYARNAVELLLQLTHSRVQVSFGDSRLLDPLVLISVVAELLIGEDAGAATDAGWVRTKLPEIAKLGEALRSSSFSAAQPPDEDDDSDDDDDAVAPPLSPISSPALSEALAAWAKSAVATAANAERPPTCAGALMEAATQLVIAQDGHAKDWNPWLPSAGSMLGASLLSFLNALLYAEARANRGIALSPMASRAYLTHGGPTQQAQVPAQHTLLANLEAAFGSTQPVKLSETPIFAAVASCPLILLALAPPWRKTLSTHLVDRYPTNLFTEEHAFNVPLTANFGSGSTGAAALRVEVDIAYLLHSIALVPMDPQAKPWLVPPGELVTAPSKAEHFVSNANWARNALRAEKPSGTNDHVTPTQAETSSQAGSAQTDEVRPESHSVNLGTDGGNTGGAGPTVRGKRSKGNASQDAKGLGTGGGPNTSKEGD